MVPMARGAATLLTLAVVALGGVAGAESVGAAPTGLLPASEPGVCTQAADLVAAGHPREALALLDRAVAGGLADACIDDHRAEADSAIAEARRLARVAQSERVTDPVGARRDADAARAQDAGNVLAAAVLAKLGPRGWLAARRADWNVFFDRELIPVRDLLLAVGEFVLGTLVLARLALLLPWPWRRWLRAGRATRWVSWAGAASASGAGGALLAFWAPSSGGGLRTVPAGVAYGLGAVGAVGFFIALGTLCRITVEVYDETGKADAARTGHVVALLGQMGAESPRGLKVPRGTDVTELADTAVQGLPTGKVVSALHLVNGSVLGIKPWRLRVDVISADRIAVGVSRHGLSLAGAVVDRGVLGLRIPRTLTKGEPKPQTSRDSRLPDLFRFAAAMMLIELAKAYRGFEGLYGVTDWRSLGLFDVATTHYNATADAEVQRKVLVEAVRHDPYNQPAVVALHRLNARGSTDPDVLRRYRTFLEKMLTHLRKHHKHGDCRALRARVSLTLLATAVNQGMLLDDEGKRPERSGPVNDPELRKVADELRSLLVAMDRSGTEVDAFVDALRLSTAAVVLSLFCPLYLPAKSAGSKQWWSAVVSVFRRLRHRQTGVDWAEEAVLQTRTSGDAWLSDVDSCYNYACYLLDPDGDGPDPQSRETQEQEGLDLLRLSMDDPANRAWALRDPWLTAWRKREDRNERRFRKAVGVPPRTDLMALEPFSGYEAALHKAGLDDLHHLAEVDPGDLARYLHEGDATVTRRLVGVARLGLELRHALAPESTDRHELHLELLACLLDQGVGTLDDARAAMVRGARQGWTVETLAGQVHRSLACVATDITEKDLATVLRRVCELNLVAQVGQPRNPGGTSLSHPSPVRTPE